MQKCKITFGRLLWNARRNHGFSQRDLCKIISKKYHSIDYYELSKIENNKVDVRSSEYDWLIPVIAEIFNVDIDWLETIRQQTQVEPFDLSQAIFPIYFNP